LKIGVLVKNVPDTEARIKLTSDQSGIETQGIKYVMNPFDEFAVEEALQIREKLQDGTTVTVLSLGPERVVETLRTALAMGADDAVHVWDPAFDGGDPLANAKVLAKVMEPMAFDLILGGKQAIDYDAAQTCAAVAEHLGISQALVVVGLELGDDKSSLEARRRVEGGDEVVSVKLPAVISCEKGLNEPRYASLPGIMKAKKKEVKKVTLAEVGLPAGEVGAAGSATKVERYAPLEERPECRMIEGEAADAAAELVRALRNDAKAV
jgi:electron transfer flavoprotein beta subunit